MTGQLRRKHVFELLALTCLLWMGTSVGRAGLINLGPGSFTPVASVITFDEFPLGTNNPTYNFTNLAGLGDVTITFGGNFLGQTTTGTFPVTLGDHTPTGPLTLDPNAPHTQIVDDSASDMAPVLSGTPTFNGPISVLFSVPVAGVGLRGGFFDAVGATTIEAYDANGAVLGSITNSTLGFEFYGLADSTGASVISGISFFITGNEPAGFEIDDLTFGAGATIITPEPSSLTLLGIGAVSLLGYPWCRRKQAAA